MKRYIILVSFVFATEKIWAQSWYSAVDAQTHQGNYFASIFASYKWNDRIGMFLWASKDAEYTDLAPGFIFSSSPIVNTKAYWEIGIGGGTTIPKDKVEGIYWYSQLYGWFETKPDQQLAKGKWIVQLNPAFTFNADDHWWLLGYATYGLTEHIAVGAHFQSGSAKGFRLEYNIPMGKGHIVRFYTVAGDGVLVGATYILQK